MMLELEKTSVTVSTFQIRPTFRQDVGVNVNLELFAFHSAALFGGDFHDGATGIAGAKRLLGVELFDDRF